MRRLTRILILLLLAISLQGSMCQEIYTRHGLWVRVDSSDSVSSVAKKYRISTSQLAKINHISTTEQLKAGDRLFIPSSRKSWVASKDSDDTPASLQPGRFRWPVDGKLTSKYGVRKGRRHDGIDISAPRGTPIKASAKGEVVFSSRLRGYGNLILVKHSGDYFTVYAHNSRNLVKKGAKVQKGQVIARVGSTGRSTGPHLHFEVRKGSHAKNPLSFLPSKGNKIASK